MSGTITSHEMSSLRTQGPITTDTNCYKPFGPSVELHRRGVWVPAFAGTTLTRRSAAHRAFELVAELGEFVAGEIADRPVVQAAIAPAPDIEALDRLDPGSAVFGAGGLGDEQIYHMRAPAVHDSGNGAGVDIIEPAADQGKALRGQVDHRRRHVELAVEPRLYGVLIGGNHVGEMPGLQRTQMRRYDLRLNPLDIVLTQHDRDQAGCGQRRYRRAHRKAAQHGA